MDPYLRNKDWLYGLGRKGCTVLVWLSAWAGLVVAAFTGCCDWACLARLADWRGFAAVVSAAVDTFGRKQPP
jgi:hypothetical protein